jgi:hypothetical protein
MASLNIVKTFATTDNLAHLHSKTRKGNFICKCGVAIVLLVFPHITRLSDWEWAKICNILGLGVKSLQ